MTSDSLPNRGLPAQKRRRLPELMRFGKSTPLTAQEQLDGLARESRVYIPRIERRLGQYRGSQLAEDVWQNALLKIAKRMDQDGEPIANVHAYMYRVCDSCAADELRRIASRSEDLFGDDPSALEEWENVRLHRSDVYYADIKPELDSLLTEMEHRALYLIEVAGFTSTMAAELMDVSPSSARKALRRARDKIRGHRPRIGQDA
ncbi:RNA polymerase sigma factor [Streptomyces lavendulae]|uniref:RNA polymerase sigma factor n=1 Tax=Streptomyces lavendulae TaxID=1914 RepID=UPI003817FC1C